MSKERIASTFDAWAADGRGESMEQGHGDVVRQVVERLNIRPGFQILDIGCGIGWATRLLASAGPGVQAVGIDASPQMIARAEELSSLRIRARYEQSLFEELDLPDGKFDLVFSMEAIYYALDLPRALAEVFRVLKSGGEVNLVIDYYAERPGTESWESAVGLPMQRFGEEDWRKQLAKAGFTAVDSERIVDSRGAGEVEDFQASECFPNWNSYLRFFETGSLWLHGEKA